MQANIAKVLLQKVNELSDRWFLTARLVGTFRLLF